MLNIRYLHFEMPDGAYYTPFDFHLKKHLEDLRDRSCLFTRQLAGHQISELLATKSFFYKASASSDVIPELSHALTDEFWVVRDAAIQAIQAFDELVPPSIILRLQQLCNDKDCRVQQTATQAIASIQKSSRPVPPFSQTFPDNLRWTEPFLGSYSSRNPTASTLIQTLEIDNNEAVRGATLASGDEVMTIQKEIQMLSHKDEEYRWKAAWSLAQHIPAPSKVIDFLKQDLVADRLEERIVAAETLIRMHILPSSPTTVFSELWRHRERIWHSAKTGYAFRYELAVLSNLFEDLAQCFTACCITEQELDIWRQLIQDACKYDVESLQRRLEFPLPEQCIQALLGALSAWHKLQQKLTPDPTKADLLRAHLEDALFQQPED